MFIIFLICLCLAQVYIGFPLLEQMMPVAKVDENYMFEVNNITYVSDVSDVTYSITGLDWLMFDNGNRSLYGVPPQEGQFNFSLVGSDEYTTTSNSYNIVVQNASTTLNLKEFASEIESFGETNGQNGIVVTPGSDFTYQFNQSIFNNLDNNSTFYGKLGDHSSLPNWISFNSDDLSFTGTVPYVTSEIAPSVSYQFAIIASDEDFSLAEGIFSLVVGANQLWVNDSQISYNGTLNLEIDLNIPLQNVFLNGESINTANISLIVPQDLPDYLKLDNYSLIGQFPNYTTTDNFSITLTDVYYNLIDFTYSIKSIDSLFSGNFLDLNATRSSYFQYQFDNSSFTSNDLVIDLDYSATWLNWHSSNYTMNGDVPDDFDSMPIEVKATNGDKEESESFELKGVANTEVTTTTTSTPSASATSSPSATATATPVNKSSGTNKKLIIGLAVGIPCLVLLLLAILLICCIKRRKNNKEKESAVDSDTEKNHIAATNHDPTPSPPKRLTSLNLLNLDKSSDELLASKEKSAYETKSTSSSLTHVESTESQYFDAPDKPIKSWRMEDKSDSKDIKTNRVSDTSLSTVNTEQLFSIRLIDDKASNRNSIQGPLNLSRDNSGNIQRLNSEGEIVEMNNHGIDILSIPKDRRTHSQNLDILLEETNYHRNFSDETRHSNNPFDTPVIPYDPTPIERSNESKQTPIYQKENSSNSLDSHDQTLQTEDSSVNLLSKVDDPQLPNSKTENFDNLNSYDHEFTATKTDNGEFKWLQSSDNSKTNLISPITAESFNFNKSNPTTVQSNMRHSNLSAISLSSTEMLNENSLNSNNSAKAKLVDFTRKGSLRQSAYEPDYRYREESAKIVEDDSD